MEKIKRFFRELKPLAAQGGLSRGRLIASFCVSRFLHGASWDNFRVLEMYRMNGAGKRKVYTYRRQKKISDFLNRDARPEDLRALMDKNAFNTQFAAFVKREWYDSAAPDREKLTRFLRDNETFLEKPILSSQGKGIELRRASDITDEDAFFREISEKKVILEGFIRQHPALSEINPTSVNTIRLITARYGDDVHVIHGGGLRCGGRDAFVDNFHSGGCAYPIDVETGIVDGPGTSLGSKTRILRHPSTGKVMPGFQIPNWDDVLRTVVGAARAAKNVGYIGWDVAVLPDGCELIEANVNYPGTNIVQLDGFTALEQVRAFMKEHVAGQWH